MLRGPQRIGRLGLARLKKALIFPSEDLDLFTEPDCRAVIYRFNTNVLDTDRRELWCGGEPVTVEPQVFDLLILLIQNNARVVSKDEIIAQIWQGRIVSDATISTRINSARRAVGDNGRDQTVIRTIVRRGFRFVADLTEDAHGYLVGGASNQGIPNAPSDAIAISATHDAASVVHSAANEPKEKVLFSRHLGAILAAEIVGYWRLMNSDESKTLAALRKMRAETFGPTIAGQRGKIIKSMGSGWLVEFSNTVDAVNCALQLQERMAGHETIKLRIGIHIGDVLHEDVDIFGDAVNLATRLQEFTQPGSVSISEPVYANLDGTLAPAFDDAGQHALKNILRPVQIWVRNPGDAPSMNSRSIGSGRAAFAGFPMLAIEPVKTSDERTDVQELAHALTNDLQTYLGSSSWLTAAIVEQPGNRNYIVRSALRGRANRLRLEVSLSSATGQQLWASKYDGDLDDTFEWQDATAEDVTSNVFGHILDAENARLSTKQLASMTAEECLLCGLMHFSAIEPGGIREGLSFFQLAISKDQDLAPAYAWAAMSIFAAISIGRQEAVTEYLPSLPEWIHKARTLSAIGSNTVTYTALAKYVSERDVMVLRREIEEGLRRAPFDPEGLYACGFGYVFLGEPQAAQDCMRKCLRLGHLNPFSATARGGMAIACVQAGRDEAAIDHAKKAIVIAPSYSAPYRALAAACAHLGRQKEASEAITRVLELVPGDSVSFTRDRSSYRDTPGVRRYLEGLRLAGLPD